MTDSEMLRRRKTAITLVYCVEGGLGPLRGCTEVVSLLHPLPSDWDTVRCPLHRKGASGDVQYADL